MQRNPPGPSGPYVHPAVGSANLSPGARKYVPGQQPAAPTPYVQPVGGGHLPIPRLDQQHRDGMTMADQALVQRGGGAPSAAGGPPPSPFLPAVSRSPAGPLPNLFPGDLLPQAAAADPLFVQGTGAQYATSQPQLAAKYGVLRNGVLIPPQALYEGKRGLSQETIDGIKAIAEAQASGVSREAELDARVMSEAAANSSAGVAARLASASSDADVRPAPAGNLDERVADAVRDMDDFDFAKFREMMSKDLLNNDDQRAIVEAAVKPMDISDLITQGYILQVVPIIPGKFYPTFRSASAEDDLSLKRLLMEESGEIEANSRYLVDKFALMTVAAMTYAINNNPLPDYRNAQGDFDRKLFLTKFNYLIKQPFHMLAALAVHSFWFEIRVRKLFVAEKLGNG